MATAITNSTTIATTGLGCGEHSSGGTRF